MTTNHRSGNFGEKGAVLFRKQSIPTLLAICYFIGEHTKQKVDIKLMIFTIDRLKEITGR